MLFIQPSMLDSNARVKESDLHVPALLVLAKAKQAGLESGINCTQLADALESIAVLSPADQMTIPGDRLTHFRRQVYNLMFHEKLEKEGWVASQPAPGTPDPMQKLFSITPKGAAKLAERAIGTLGVPKISQEAADSDRRTLEKDIKLPSLYLLAGLEQTMERPVPMTTLRTTLRSVLPKSRVDMETLKNRNDSRLDQIIRNLISHNTLKNEGWAKRTAEGMSVTQAGYEALLGHVIRALPTPPMFARPSSLSQAMRQPEKAPESVEAPAAPSPRSRRRNSP